MFGLRGWNWGTTTGRLADGPAKIYWHEGTAIDAPPEGDHRRAAGLGLDHGDAEILLGGEDEGARLLH